MKKTFSVTVLLSVGVLIYSTIANGAESYVINLVADAMILRPAANNFGSFTFLNRVSGRLGLRY